MPAGWWPKKSPVGMARRGTPWVAEIDSKVFSLAVGTNGDLYAGGDFTTAGDVQAKKVARWDGRRAVWATG